MGDQLSLPTQLLPSAPVDLCGCHPTASADLLIATMTEAGLGTAAIAHRLNAAGVPTGSGRGRWHSETVLRRLKREQWNAYMRDYRRRARV
jgi:hypothetical protein